MCLNHNLRLYFRCLNLFKLLFSVYMIIYGATVCADLTLQQAFGADMLGLGVGIVIIGITKPLNIVMSHYGSTRHNKCALLMVIVFDGISGAAQLSIGATLVVRGQPLYEKSILKACARTVLATGTRENRCNDYWEADRTAGMRLAWMSLYYRGVRENESAQTKLIEQIQDFGNCCGFGPPAACQRVQNKKSFPNFFERNEQLDSEMTHQRFSCSADYDCNADDDDTSNDDAVSFCWYPVEEGTCEHFASDDISNSRALGCRYDWGIGSCLDADTSDSTRGCAWYFEQYMDEKIFGHGIVLMVMIFLEFWTICAGCCFCWKRKETDVLPISYVYDEPYDPAKAGKLALYRPQQEGAGGGNGKSSKNGGTDNDDDDYNQPGS